MVLPLPIRRLELPFGQNQRRTALPVNPLLTSKQLRQQHSQDSGLSSLSKGVLHLVRDQVLQKEELGLECLLGDACRFLHGLVSE